MTRNSPVLNPNDYEILRLALYVMLQVFKRDENLL